MKLHHLQLDTNGNLGSIRNVVINPLSIFCLQDITQPWEPLYQAYHHGQYNRLSYREWVNKILCRNGRVIASKARAKVEPLFYSKLTMKVPPCLVLYSALPLYQTTVRVSHCAQPSDCQVVSIRPSEVSSTVIVLCITIHIRVCKVAHGAISHQPIVHPNL